MSNIVGGQRAKGQVTFCAISLPANLHYFHRTLHSGHHWESTLDVSSLEAFGEISGWCGTV